MLHTNVKDKRSLIQKFRNSELPFEDIFDLSDEDVREIEYKNNQLKTARDKIKLNREKINGIMPGELDHVDVEISYQGGAVDSTQIQNG